MIPKFTRQFPSLYTNNLHYKWNTINDNTDFSNIPLNVELYILVEMNHGDVHPCVMTGFLHKLDPHIAFGQEYCWFEDCDDPQLLGNDCTVVAWRRIV